MLKEMRPWPLFGLLLAACAGTALSGPTDGPIDGPIPDRGLLEDDLAPVDGATDFSSVSGDLAGDMAALPVPKTFGSSGIAPVFWTNNYARPFKLTLASDLPGARIYYTTDGSAPTTSSANGLTPVTGIQILQSSTVRYFATLGPAVEVEHSDAYGVSTALQTSAGYTNEDTSLDGVTPTLITTPGTVLSGARTTYTVWVQQSCPLCAVQLVYGVDAAEQGCLYDNSPGVYPGATGMVTFTVTAPTTPGYHEVRVAHIEQTNCTAAIAAKALTTRPTIARIAVLYVK
jgi:hypothetical protein